MGKKVATEFEECIKRGKLKKIEETADMVVKELRVAHDDLETARAGLKESRWKWSTIQSYYAMFHTARALLFSRGYREKSHYCLKVAIETLFVSEGKLSDKYIEAFQTAKLFRENADYEEDFSDTSAIKLVKIANDFLKEAKHLLRKK